jgi:chromosome segregation ATPase
MNFTTVGKFVKEWGSLLTLLGIAAAAGGVSARVSSAETNLKEKDQELKKELDEQDKEIDDAKAELHSQDKRLQRREDQDELIQRQLTRIEAKVEAILLAPPPDQPGKDRR